MITTLLWDVDGTLLDFEAAERAAVKRLFGEFGLGVCTDEMVRRYSVLNLGYWQRLERGEITKDRVLVERFAEFFAGEGIDPALAGAFNRRYQTALGDTIVCRDDSLALVRSLRGRVKQYVVSNGTVVAQTKKLRRSGLGEAMDGVFLSEEIGVEKPNRGFFDYVLAHIDEKDPDRILIVGDSLTSDIQGGMNAGIRTAWYHPEGGPVPAPYRADAVITDLRQVTGLLGGGDAAVDYRRLFDGMHPGFFRSAGIRAMPEDEVFAELVLDLRRRPPLPAGMAPEGITFGEYRGDAAALRETVRQVDKDWAIYFGGYSRAFCAFDGDRAVSFCLLSDWGVWDGLRVGGPGCVGTIPGYRGRGIGLELVRRATNLLQARGFDLSWIHFTHLAGWYQKLGYTTVLRWNSRGMLADETGPRDAPPAG